jgi:hypothetical protein
MFWEERGLYVFIQQTLELVFIPPRINLFSFDDKSGIFSKAMPQRFIDSKKRLDIDELDEKTMFIEPG